VRRINNREEWVDVLKVSTNEGIADIDSGQVECPFALKIDPVVCFPYFLRLGGAYLEPHGAAHVGPFARADLHHRVHETLPVAWEVQQVVPQPQV
jgi:hypothetical protein